MDGFNKILKLIKDDDQLGALELYASTFTEERICELVKELMGNKSVKVVRNFVHFSAVCRRHITYT